LEPRESGQLTMRSKFTSVALKKSVLARLDDLSGRIIPGIKISIPKTIEILTQSANKGIINNDRNTELTRNNRKTS
jgi:hypothetical protein